MASDSDIRQAMARAEEMWSTRISHIDCEQAYLDRAWLARRVRQLEQQVIDLERDLYAAVAEAERNHREDTL